MPLRISSMSVVLLLLFVGSRLEAQGIPDIQRTQEDQARLEAIQQRARQAIPALRIENLRLPRVELPAQLVVPNFAAPRNLVISISVRTNGNRTLSLALRGVMGDAAMGMTAVHAEETCQRLREELMRRANDIVKKLNETQPLTESQEWKLILAASLQINQYERDLKDWYAKYGNGAANDRGQLVKAMAAASKLNDALNDCFESEDSLFVKVKTNQFGGSVGR